MHCCIPSLFLRATCLGLLAAALAVMGGTAPAQTVLLNEIQVSNGITLVDENGDTPDWIELFNPGSSAVDLNGWGLSDSTNALFKWTFTNATIAPGGYMVVLASGKDRQTGAYPAVNPSSVGGLRVWLRADAVNTNDPAQVRFVGAASYVRSWRDQSGNGQHAGQGTDAYQPLFVPSAAGVGGGP